MSNTYKHKKLYECKQKEIKEYTNEEWELWWKLCNPVSNIFKKLKKKSRKAKEKQAIKNKEYDKVPLFKKSDKYDFW